MSLSSVKSPAFIPIVNSGNLPLVISHQAQIFLCHIHNSCSASTKRVFAERCKQRAKYSIVKIIVHIALIENNKSHRSSVGHTEQKGIHLIC